MSTAPRAVTWGLLVAIIALVFLIAITAGSNNPKAVGRSAAMQDSIQVQSGPPNRFTTRTIKFITSYYTFVGGMINSQPPAGQGR